VVGPGDLPSLRQLFGRLSTRTAYQRFLSASPVSGEEYVDSLRDSERTLDAVLAVRQGASAAWGPVRR
jgi:hypothetical protein